MREFFFYTGSIHFRQFPATLVLVAEKPPPPGWGKLFLHWIYPFQSISSNFVFCGRKAPPPTPIPQDKGNFFYTGSIHFRQFPATLVFVAEMPSPPPPHDDFHCTRTSTRYERLFARNGNPSSSIVVLLSCIMYIVCVSSFSF